MALLSDSHAGIPSLLLWHLRFGHINGRRLVAAMRKGTVVGLPSRMSNDLVPFCDACVQSKHTKANRPRVATHPYPHGLLSLVSGDVGVVNHTSVGGYRYFLVFICVHSRRNWLYLLKCHTDVPLCIEAFHRLCVVQYGINIKSLRFDGEFKTNRIRDYARSMGCRLQLAKWFC